MKILIVEDEKDSRIFLERRLQKEGYTIFSAVNGVEALECVRETKPDIIISDIMMPEMDGFELCRRLKANESFRSVPFLFYTATFLDRKDEKLAMALGGDRFLVKPMKIERLLEIIREVHAEHQEGKFEVPDKPVKGDDEISAMYSESIGRKLGKKVKELEKEHRALQQSEEKYKELVNSLLIGIFEMDTNGLLTFVNRNGSELFGYTQDDFDKGISVLQLIIPEERDRALANMKRRLNGEPLGITEYTVLKKDGERFFVSLQSNIVIHDGKTIGLRGILIDISERKQSENRYRTLFDNAPDSIFTLEGSGLTIKNINKKALDTFKRTFRTFKERKWNNLKVC